MPARFHLRRAWLARAAGLLAAWPLGRAAAQDREALVLIGHAGLPRVDLAAVQRLYTGRAVELQGVPVVLVNLPRNTKLRERFMAEVLQQEDDRYVAYWTVRRHIGKGTPPRELPSPAEVVDFVATTPGGIGYVAQTDLRPGVSVLMRV